MLSSDPELYALVSSEKMNSCVFCDDPRGFWNGISIYLKKKEGLCVCALTPGGCHFDLFFVKSHAMKHN